MAQIGDIVTHIFREHKQEADHLANLGTNGQRQVTTEAVTNSEDWKAVRGFWGEVANLSHSDGELDRGEPLTPDNLERHNGTLSGLPLPSELVRKETAEQRNKMLHFGEIERRMAHNA